MSRSGYVEDYDYDQWQMIKWRGQVAGTMRGKRGQAFLNELIDALDAMPEKRLIAGHLIQDGAVCAIGSVGIRRGIDMSEIDPDDYHRLVDVFGIPHQLVREIEYENDESNCAMTPEQRWQRMRSWAIEQLNKAAAK